MRTDISASEQIVIEPHEGFQTIFAMSNVDIVFGAGTVNSGKSFALVLAMAEPLMTDPDFRALISRKSLGNLKAGGGFVDTFQSIFGEYVEIRQADSPRASFNSGAFCDMTYVDDSNIDKLRERAKGWQYDLIAIDELTEMSWEAFTYMLTRNRGRSKTFSGKFFATFNPKRSHWTRTFCDWYIDFSGNVIPERDGHIRYFYVTGDSVKDIEWGDSKEEVYLRCKIDIDRKIKRLGSKFNYTNFIKSFVLYTGTMAENKAMMEKNPDYVGSVSASGGRLSQQLVEMNFNVDPDENNDVPITNENARQCFENDPATNGDKWITVDLADYGTDNLVALSWNGFHINDILILGNTTPRENARQVKLFAEKNSIATSRIIYDATSGRYFQDYIEESIPYVSNSHPRGMYALSAANIKALCYMRLVKMIKRGEFTFDDTVRERTYTHRNLKYRVTVENEFLEECSVVRFSESPSGRKSLFTKKQMNAMLGKGRSMDLLDPCAMRMLPCLDLEYGRELEEGRRNSLREIEETDIPLGFQESIYNEHFWY